MEEIVVDQRYMVSLTNTSVFHRVSTANSTAILLSIHCIIYTPYAGEQNTVLIVADQLLEERMSSPCRVSSGAELI